MAAPRCCAVWRARLGCAPTTWPARRSLWASPPRLPLKQLQSCAENAAQLAWRRCAAWACPPVRACACARAAQVLGEFLAPSIQPNASLAGQALHPWRRSARPPAGSVLALAGAAARRRLVGACAAHYGRCRPRAGQLLGEGSGVRCPAPFRRLPALAACCQRGARAAPRKQAASLRRTPHRPVRAL